MKKDEIIYRYSFRDGVLTREPFIVKSEDSGYLLIYSMVNPKKMDSIHRRLIDSGDAYASNSGIHCYQSKSNRSICAEAKKAFGRYYHEQQCYSQDSIKELETALFQEKENLDAWIEKQESLKSYTFIDLEEEEEHGKDL